MLTLPLLVEPQSLQAQLNHPDLLIIDPFQPGALRSRASAGAVLLDPARLLRGAGPVPNRIPTEAQLSRLLSELGIRP